MLGKLIVHAADRPAAVRAMCQAVAAFDVQGIQTTLPFLGQLMAMPAFQSGQINTRWAEQVLAQSQLNK
jgi:biotin carboxylase